jgi:crotonobetainyl-CoA:carnitine CoA-transferase CaiB-like acyl-CoA transferase
MRVLDGLTVVEMTAGASGPFCGRLLGDWGARVVKIERPGSGDLSREWDTLCNGLSAGFVWLNRNKESVVLDLKRAEARQVIERLIRRADVVLENQLPGAVDRLGLGYEAVRAWTPGIVYCHISGYGPSGPYADMKAFDALMQGETGVMEMNGVPESMAKVPLSICDLAAGMYAAQAILGALLHRARSGEGQDIQVSMFDSVMDWLGYFPYYYWHKGRLPERVGARHHLLTPYGPYTAGDGKAVNIAVLSQEHWRLFCAKVLGHPELIEDRRFADNEARMANREALEGFLAQVFATAPQDHWMERLQAAGIPCGRVNRLDDVLRHPVLEHSGQVKMVASRRGALATMDNPVRWSTAENRVDFVAELGEHTDGVLRELGYTDGEIAGLRAMKAVQ